MFDKHHILFYSPERKVMTVKTAFKRPLPVLEKKIGICPRCSNSAVISIQHPKRKKSIEVHHSVCDRGHIEVEIVNLLNSDFSYSYF